MYNPFKAVIPPLMTFEEFSEKITRRFSIEQFHELEGKLETLSRLRKELFIVLPRHYDFYISVHTMLKSSYQNRNWCKFIEAISQLNEWEKNPQKLPKLMDTPEASSSLIGELGMGKTTTLDLVLKLFPERVDHNENFILKQVPVVKIECSTKGSMRQMCLSFFSELDRIVQWDYSLRFKNADHGDLVRHLYRYSLVHQIGLLVIDEINYLADHSGSVSKEIMNSLSRFSNTVGIPVLAVGTPRAKEFLFYEDLQVGSRYEGVGYSEWLPLREFEEDGSPGIEWNYFMNVLWKYSVMDEPTELSDEVKQLYFRITKGLIRFLIHLHINAQTRAVNAGDTKLTLDHIKEAAENNMKGTAKLLATFNVPVIRTTQQTPPLKSNFEIENKIKDVLNQAHEIYSDVPTERVKEIVEGFFKKYPTLSVNRCLEKLHEVVLSLRTNHKTNGASEKPRPIGKLFILTNTAKGSEEIYQRLRQSGYIASEMTIQLHR